MGTSLGAYDLNHQTTHPKYTFCNILLISYMYIVTKVINSAHSY